MHKTLTEADAAYLAGLIDGEGTIGCRPRRDGYLNTELGICMTTPAPLHWARRTTGVGAVYYRPQNRPGRRNAWFWKVGAVDQIAGVLQQIKDHLLVKRIEASAFLVLAHLRRTKSRRFGPSPCSHGEDMAAAIVKRWKTNPDPVSAYEEALDLACYLRQAIEERNTTGGPP